MHSKQKITSKVTTWKWTKYLNVMIHTFKYIVKQKQSASRKLQTIKINPYYRQQKRSASTKLQTTKAVSSQISIYKSASSSVPLWIYLFLLISISSSFVPLLLSPSQFHKLFHYYPSTAFNLY